jgi:eukaryotic-like serine/threonine-protein kinase
METPKLPPRYQVKALIGEGATGAVWHATDGLLGEDVAIKVVRPALALHRRFRARFAREVALAAQVVHPKLVPLFEQGETADGLPFVVMAHADAGNLGSLLCCTPRLDHVVYLMTDVLDALAAIHARGFVHQDIKPQNVLLYTGSDNRLNGWVSDLGEANSLALLVQNRKEVGGTPVYMAPEQLMEESQEMGPWTDLYAVGLMLYEVLAGAPPHAASGRKELLALRLQPPFPPSALEGSQIPPSLVEIVTNLLDPEPRQRYDRAADVKRLLLGALDEVATGVRLRPLSLRKAASTPHTLGPILPSGEAPLAGIYSFGGGGDFSRWNQVFPPALPERPPPGVHVEVGPYAGLSLFGLRELPLVGRSEQQQQIWSVAAQVAARGEPGVVLVVGDSGTGKTRLVESIALSLDEGGFMEVIRLRYHAPPGIDDGYRGAVKEILAPWYSSRNAIENRLCRWLSRDRQAPVDTVATEAAVLSRWCGRLEADEAPVNAAVGLAFLYRHLDAHAWRGGSCLILDDAHRSVIEGDGLDIARALLDRTVGERPVLVLVTISAEAVKNDEALADRIHHLAARGAQVIELPYLTREETREIIDRALPLEPQLADRIAANCAGNPLAVRLLLQDWTFRGHLVLGPHRQYGLKDGLSIDALMPRSIEELYLSSLQAAVQSTEDPAATAEALAATALAGSDPPLPVIRDLSESGLDALLSTGVLRCSGNTLVFEHSSVERTARAQADALPDAARLHRSLAVAWETLAEKSAMNADFQVGHHYLEGGLPKKAVLWLVRSGRTLLDEGLPGHAANAARLALRAADATDVAVHRQEARRLMAQVMVEMRDCAEAEHLIEDALRIEPVDRLTRARLAVLSSKAAMGRGSLDLCRQFLDQARLDFESVQDREGLLDVAHGRASAARQAGDPQTAIVQFREALRLVRRDPRREVLLLSGLVEALLLAGGHREVEPYRQRMMQVAQESGDTRNIAQAAHTSGLVNFNRRRLDLACRYFQTASALSSTLGAHKLRLNCENSLGEVARFRDHLDEAAFHYERCARYAEEEGMPAAAALGHVNLAMLCLTSQDWQAMDPHLDNAELAISKLPRHWIWAPVGVLRAIRMAHSGDEPHTRAWWAVAREHGLEKLRTPDLFPLLRALAEAASVQGWMDIARNALDLTRDRGRHVVILA